MTGLGDASRLVEEVTSALGALLMGENAETPLKHPNDTKRIELKDENFMMQEKRCEELFPSGQDYVQELIVRQTT